MDTNRPHVTDAKIIHWGVDVDQYSYEEVSHNPERLLYVRQIVRHEGDHTAVEALKVFIHQYGYGSVPLTIDGQTIVPDYGAYVQRLVVCLGLESNVHFIRFVSHESLPSVYQEHDILVSPSIWKESFGITLLQTMSSSLAVVDTAIGGRRKSWRMRSTL